LYNSARAEPRLLLNLSGTDTLFSHISDVMSDMIYRRLWPFTANSVISCNSTSDPRQVGTGMLVGQPCIQFNIADVRDDRTRCGSYSSSKAQEDPHESKAKVGQQGLEGLPNASLRPSKPWDRRGSWLSSYRCLREGHCGLTACSGSAVSECCRDEYTFEPEGNVSREGGREGKLDRHGDI
jgi:hypothetical protein